MFSYRYPTNKWLKLGTFHARDERTVQSFPLDEHLYAKYVKVSTVCLLCTVPLPSHLILFHDSVVLQFNAVPSRNSHKFILCWDFSLHHFWIEAKLRPWHVNVTVTIWVFILEWLYHVSEPLGDFPLQELQLLLGGGYLWLALKTAGWGLMLIGPVLAHRLT